MIIKMLNIFKRRDTDKKVAEIYKEPIAKAKQVNSSLKKVNKLLYHKDTTYFIARALNLKLRSI